MMLLPALLVPDVIARAAVVEGFNTNTYQAQDNPAVPVIERHPSPFTGLDGSLELRFLGRDIDRTTVIVGGRLNHYEPLQPENQSDDGAFNGSIATVLTLGPRTTFSMNDSAAVTSFDAAHVTDGTMFAFDPTQVRSTYWIDDGNMTITHLLAPNWRVSQSLGIGISGTLHAAPTQLANGQLVEHRGLDYVTPYAETDLNHEFNPRVSGDVSLLYQYSYDLYVYDFTQNPPKNIGPDKQASLTMLTGTTYRFSDDFAAVARVGLVLASAPPRDIDQRAVLSPAAMGEAYYTRPSFDLVATAGYTWGTVNPRLGSGPAASASALAIGTPSRVGNWKNFAIIGNIQGSYSTLITGVDESTKLGLIAGGIQARYALNRWLGVVGGYDARAATFDAQSSYQPPFVQQVFFVGVSGYWATDRDTLPLTTFAAPVQPPS
jgi:hypothetical protein